MCLLSNPDNLIIALHGHVDYQYNLSIIDRKYDIFL